jgi:Ni/Fe-hydrogenase subunit HybB-like protein
MADPASHVSLPEPPSMPPPHLATYPRFLWCCVRLAFHTTPLFLAWMIVLTAVALVGANAWAHQVAEGMHLTGMSDHVSWGLYIANFTFLVGLAAGGVMMVIPAYLYGDEDMHDVVIFGEILALAALVMCLGFVTVDLGRPDRFWHLVPPFGRFNWPMSMLTWDVIVLNGYLLLNLHVVGYLLYTRYLGRRPRQRWYLPFVLLSIVWAISIHTVTAFLYSGLGGRPFWNTAVLAPRFLTSAFVTGPAFMIVALHLIRRFTGFHVSDRPVATLTSIVRITALLNLFLLGAELFTEFYTGGAHVASARYLFFGLHGHTALVPWIWTAIACNVAGAAMFLSGRARTSPAWLQGACLLVFVGVWIEKGMGLIIPAFVPSTLHELVEYVPSATEWKIMAGIWAFGLGIFTVALRVGTAVLTSRMRWMHVPVARDAPRLGAAR